jgi:hypothetical protein
MQENSLEKQSEYLRTMFYLFAFFQMATDFFTAATFLLLENTVLSKYCVEYKLTEHNKTEPNVIKYFISINLK